MLRDTAGDKVVIAQTMYPGATVGYPFAHRLFPSSKQEAELLATHAAAQGLSRVAILHVKNEWGLESAAVFRKTLEAKAGQIVATEMYTFADKDFRPMLNKLIATSPQAILSGVRPSPGAAGWRAARLGSVRVLGENVAAAGDGSTPDARHPRS
jgi:ABC-type branched-subunit amino acid transport system substrate-binding protein